MTELLQKFQLVDASYCFLSKQKALLSTRNVLNLASSLGSVVLTDQDLNKMQEIAPNLLQFKSVPFKQIYKEEEFHGQVDERNASIQLIVFAGVPHCSNRARAKRKKLFMEALGMHQNPDSMMQSSGGDKRKRKRDEPTSHSLSHKLLMGLDADHVCRQWLENICKLDWVKDQLVHIERRPARAAQSIPLSKLSLSACTMQALGKKGVQYLYSHQYAAIQAIQKGSNVLLCTSTASGKSLAYMIPTIEMFQVEATSNELTSCCVYLFPTKALAQDQQRSVREYLTLVSLPASICCTFDGDTPKSKRDALIRHARIFLTNPDMLHHTILPQHRRWKHLLSKLRYIVIDEAHMYRGAFGTHVACVFRRLFRICALYGAYPQVICCSATIGNPREHFSNLIPTLSSEEVKKLPSHFVFIQHRSLELIDEDGSPTGEKLMCLWNPTSRQQEHVIEAKKDMHEGDKQTKDHKKVDDGDGNNENEEFDVQMTASPIFQSACMLANLMKQFVHTILFCQGRKLAELVLMNVLAILHKDKAAKNLAKRVLAYRGGYTPSDRRRIEQRLFRGDLLGVVATSALELGIDIGQLDCTLHLGLPSNIASLWQQAGRAGRKDAAKSLAIILCFNSPLDQYFCRHPAQLFARKPEAVCTQRNNSIILQHHLLCAAREAALYSSRTLSAFLDEPMWNLKDDEHLQLLVRDKKLINLGEDGYKLHPCISPPLRHYNLRSTTDLNYKVFTENSADSQNMLELDEIPERRAFFQIYPTAVYLHQGQEYLITHIDHEGRYAIAKRCAEKLTYFSSPRDFTNIDIMRSFSLKRLDSTVSQLNGIVMVITTIFGSTYYKKRSMVVIQRHIFSLPLIQFASEAIWIELSEELRNELERLHYHWIGALHGIGHILLTVLPLFIHCDPGDVDTEHYHPKEQRARPNRITIYENREEGNGIVIQLLSIMPQAVQKALDILRECMCMHGCPSCLHSSRCSEYNQVLDKGGSLYLLEKVAMSYQNHTRG